MFSVGIAVLLTFPAHVLNARQVKPAPSFACDLAPVQDRDRLNTLLAERVIDALERAARPGWRDDAKLAALIRRNAEITIGRSYLAYSRIGIQGVRYVAVKLASAHYRFKRLEGIPAPVLSGCEKLTVTIEFVREGESVMTTGHFICVDGVIESATAYDIAFVSGRLARAGEQPSPVSK